MRWYMFFILILVVHKVKITWNDHDDGSCAKTWGVTELVIYVGVCNTLRAAAIRQACCVQSHFNFTYKGAIPGTFFWKPRLALDLAIPTTEPSMSIQKPTIENVKEGLVVLVDGYQAGLTVIALTAGLSSGSTYPHLSPFSAFFYTNSYRWALRYFSLIPFWLGGHGGNFCDSHKTWRRRFYYMDEFMPKWLRNLFPYVKKEEWDKEEWEMKRFKKYSEPAFGKHYRYPSKKFRNFQSQLTQDTVENSDSQNSIDR